MEANEKCIKVLLGCTGDKESSQVFTLLNLLQNMKIQEHSLEVQVVVTSKAMHYLSFQKLQSLCKVYRDVDEWERWNRREVLHIELRRWADVFIIAPMDAETLGKVANGICDNLLTCIIRAWDRKKPLILCPSMDVGMWRHPLTNVHLSTLKEYGYTSISPEADEGGMADLSTISQKLVEILNDLPVIKNDAILRSAVKLCAEILSIS